MKRTIGALAVATAMMTSVVWAQAEPDMDEALSMLETAAGRELAGIGVTDVDPMSLSLNQLAQIKSIMGSSDYNESEKQAQIRQLIGEN